MGWHSWNEEAMTSMVDDLKQPWSDVCLTLHDNHFKSTEQIEKLIGKCTGKHTSQHNGEQLCD